MLNWLRSLKFGLVVAAIPQVLGFFFGLTSELTLPKPDSEAYAQHLANAWAVIHVLHGALALGAYLLFLRGIQTRRAAHIAVVFAAAYVATSVGGLLLSAVVVSVTNAPLAAPDLLPSPQSALAAICSVLIVEVRDRFRRATPPAS